MPPTNRYQLSPNQKRSGVFISYARSDGSEFAHRLHQQLEQHDIKPWQDRVAMEGGRDWWLQITEAINGASFLLLVLTPGALQSKIVRDEWRYARQQGICVYTIKGSPDIDYASLPRWMRNTHCYDLGLLEDGDLSPEWPKFLNDLKKTPDVRRVPFMVEDLSANHVHRSREFDQLIALLLDRTHEEPVAITAALRGAGGYGKTTIAKSLCHNEEIQDAFDDGILWVTLGETPGDLTGRVEDLIQTISGDRPGFSNLEAAITRFTELLADRDILLVIDDVWNRDHLRPFLQGGRRCARLITTRNLDTLPPQAQPVKVDAMRAAEAVEMLRTGLPDGEVAGCDGELAKLAVRLGEWPLLLGLVGGALHDRVLNTNQLLPEAIAYVNRALDKRGLTFFDARDTDSRNQAVAKTMGVSLDLLKPAERARYDELAVFPEDVNIPLATLGKFWSSTGEAYNFDAEFDTEELCTRLNRLSLLHTFDAKARHIRLHDVVRQYLMDAQRNRLAELHGQLLDAHRPITPSSSPQASNWGALPDNDPYFWDHLAAHLIAANRGEELVATVKDWRYLAKKTLLRKSPAVEQDLLKAEKAAPADDPLRMLRRSFANTGHLFNHCEGLNDIEVTLFCRLQHLQDLEPILQNVEQRFTLPYMVPKFDLPDLPHSALIRTLEGHSSYVTGCAFSPDGKLIVSASWDGTLKVWDAESGELQRTLEGHSSVVNGCAFSPDGKVIISASWDRTLKVWDAQSGEMLLTLEGHSDCLNSCVFSPDGKLIASTLQSGTLNIRNARSGEILRAIKEDLRVPFNCEFSPDGRLIASASSDPVLKVWDVKSGEVLRTFEGHSNSVRDCAFSPNGKYIVSASYDKTLKVWDVQSGEPLHTLEGHLWHVNGCAFSPDGELIVSASADDTLKVWDSQSDVILRTLEGHTDEVMDCAFSPDGKLLASASRDKTLKIWDAQSGEIISTQNRHLSWVNDCAISPDGKLTVSASSDHTLKLWDTKSGRLLHTLKSHSDIVNGCAFSFDGELIASASSDHTLKVWDARSGEMLRTIEGHSDSVMDCAFTPNGKWIVSASDDKSLKVWDVQTGETVCTIEGHSDRVNDCVVSPDGELIVSTSADNTLKVWDAQSGEMLHTLEGHSDLVMSCAFSPDGKLIVSACWDNTLKVWDGYSNQVLHHLYGHSSSVQDCTFSPDGNLIISASNDHTLKVWETQSGNYLATFFADGPLFCCAAYGEIIVAGGARGVYFLRLVR